MGKEFWVMGSAFTEIHWRYKGKSEWFYRVKHFEKCKVGTK